MNPKPPGTASASALIGQLGQHFAVIQDGRPLALGIHKAILARLPDLDPGQLRSAMKAHTQSTRYLKGLLATQDRFNLDGQVDGDVTNEQRQIAQATLEARFQRIAERRRAERRAQEEATRQARAEQERQAKLAQLVARFNGR
jgi:ProP effector